MKPEITKEQAEAITYLRGLGRDDEYILRNHREYIMNCAVLNKLSLVSLAAALINGYEIVMTPEEVLQEYYVEAFHTAWDERAGHDIQDAIRYTLETLGIKIEGVNA
ncbi:hypothetical protein [Bacillus sp. 005/A4HT-01/001]|uniref:hypothetical protein n=1 Tax=Bacillus sp. 005/A4HT-01/001 TaxID=2509010 RepID=UPI001074A807|nr:hypothetical protein [Bacillus sp. 005/A4HT-01/001]TFW49268.1 hypothetical protein ES896_02290 [Bacillus sp. 005/A4HT-01/001]